ncbi:MAG: NAD(P)H-hydrate dehydratase [Candidatus Alcyoniella australis]|nr:NAD(P)H-hydrate dehydratase [Candidatus Alcyoniella australis]
MLLVCGTIPHERSEPILGPAVLDNGTLVVGDLRIPCGQGTAAMISAACAVTQHLGIDPPHALLAGDIGQGKGSRALYRYLSQHIRHIAPQVLCLHYMLPIVTLIKQLEAQIERCKQRPLLLADAGAMYAAKAAGLARRFDVFTPDRAELAFLADPRADHPAYIAEHLIYDCAADPAKQIARAYKEGNAPQLTLIKGAEDLVARAGVIQARIDSPNVPQMEAVGGTGDTITGLLAALLYAGLEPHEAAIIAAKANRAAGSHAAMQVDSSIVKLIQSLPEVLNENLCAWSGVCTV